MIQKSLKALHVRLRSSPTGHSIQLIFPCPNLASAQSACKGQRRQEGGKGQAEQWVRQAGLLWHRAIKVKFKNPPLGGFVFIHAEVLDFPG